METLAPGTPRRRQRRIAIRFAAMIFGLATALLAAETALHWFPKLIPANVLLRYPPEGVEFFVPGLLDRTPLSAVPLPTGRRPYQGPPPHDASTQTSWRGLQASEGETETLVLPADEDGLPNAVRYEHPDVVLVGDSFAALAGQTQPKGLVPSLEQKLDVKIFNLGIPGIGPIHESWLLRNLGVAKKPQAVVWFFYGGNDFQDTFYLQKSIARGIATHGERRHDTRRPFWILPTIVASWWSGPPVANKDELPPFQLPGKEHRFTWFHPDKLRFLAMSEQMMRPSPAAAAILQSLDEGRKAAAEIGAEFLVVYIPSKEQVWLPYAELPADLLTQYLEASTLAAIPVPDDPQAAAKLLRANCGALEGLCANWCAIQNVAYWSATKTLRDEVENGRQPYYRADSHWRAEGQTACVAAIAAQLRTLGVGR